MAELKLDMEELQHLLKLAGVHSHDKGEEEHDHQDDEPKSVIMVKKGEEDGDSAMQFPRTDVDPDASMTTDKQVLTNIIRDRLKDYLRNSK
tara:strand:+ start:531 stop:803 length:273 start_codon:yes stop_codon:yes gene_type:complete